MKKILVLALLVTMAFFISACGLPSTITYEGKERAREDVEELLESKIELENPDLDIEVTITNDTE